MNRVAVLLALAVALASAACSARRSADVPELALARTTFAVTVTARGELRAETSTPIQVPPTLPGMQTVAWLAEDGARVKAGDVVARLDEEPTEIALLSARREVQKLEHAIGAKEREQAKQLREIADQIAITGDEQRVARDYAPRDPEVFSRFEIIEAQDNLGLIQKKTGLYESKRTRQQKKHAADNQLLTLQRRTQQLKVDQATDARGRLELVAPHDGVFLVGRNWRGEKVAVGNSVWRGMVLGELPDLSKLESRVQVLESEAAGIAPGNPAAVMLDADPSKRVDARVKSIEAVAQPIEEGSPVKYFEVVLTLDRTDAERMRPGQQLMSSIDVARQESVIAVPNQAVFHKGNETWVHVREGGRWTRRAVELGARSLTRTVVTRGLAIGDVIALAEPAEAGR